MYEQSGGCCGGQDRVCGIGIGIGIGNLLARLFACLLACLLAGPFVRRLPGFQGKLMPYTGWTDAGTPMERGLVARVVQCGVVSLTYAYLMEDEMRFCCRLLHAGSPRLLLLLHSIHSYSYSYYYYYYYYCYYY